ncbi:MAG: 16S rRNA (cytidine(1402)-2'-O)-methyltransferase [Acidimicrobiia bacterium]|nr:16S rRNA (cytidine(1402)-2'-O)-methyltransferase [Acidimicrobiia bacterium]
MVSGKLILCATPIGNLGDASARLKIELEGADLVYAEDTRRAAKLLQALDVRTKVRSYFVGNEEHRSREVARHLEAGETVVLITDAGMPSIADPGLSAVRAALEVAAEVTVVPGPSAVTAALAVSGLPAERFVFEGFLPRKGNDRSRRLAEFSAEPRTIVLFSTKQRIGRDLSDLAGALGGTRQVVVARELTKAFEEVWRGRLDEAAAYWGTREPKGEFTLVIGGAADPPIDLDQAILETQAAVAAGESMTDAVRRIAAELGVGRRDLYEAMLRESH